jgi:glycosyltransferase involved in cell wall biosynthesis
MKAPHRVCCILFGDIRFDSRSSKFLQTLASRGYDTSAVIVPESSYASYPSGIIIRPVTVSRTTPTKIRLLIFYWKALIIALRSRASIILAAELYSLPAAWLASVLTGAKLVYDSRELYSAIAALQKRRFTQRFWAWCERFFGRRASSIITVNETLAKILKETFPRQRVHVVRNIPFKQKVSDQSRLRTRLNISTDKKIVLYQGGLQEGRGIGILLSIAPKFHDTEFVFLGSGILGQSIEAASRISPNIHLIDAVPMTDLIGYTAGADIGWCMIENYGISYYNSLPNKLFEYIMAEVPVIGSAFPEIKKIIDTYDVGITADPADTAGITDSLHMLLTQDKIIKQYRDNCRAAAEILTWQKESEFLLEAFSF